MVVAQIVRESSIAGRPRRLHRLRSFWGVSHPPTEPVSPDRHHTSHGGAESWQSQFWVKSAFDTLSTFDTLFIGFRWRVPDTLCFDSHPSRDNQLKVSEITTRIGSDERPPTPLSAGPGLGFEPNGDCLFSGRAR
jgi:hypothetical protein